VEFEGKETIQQVRHALQNLYSITANFLLAFGRYALDNLSTTLDNIEDLRNLSEITLIDGTGVHLVANARGAQPAGSAPPTKKSIGQEQSTTPAEKGAPAQKTRGSYCGVA
jgi:hypothetical protein